MPLQFETSTHFAGLATSRTTLAFIIAISIIALTELNSAQIKPMVNPANAQTLNLHN